MTNTICVKDYESPEYHVLYGELIRAARSQGVVTYQQLAVAINLPTSGNHMGSRLGEILGAIAENEYRQGRPMLSAVAVRASGEPGGGFYTLAHDLELLPGKDEDKAFWEKEKTACYTTWKQSFSKK